jgi:hypothetical protein
MSSQSQDERPRIWPGPRSVGRPAARATDAVRAARFDGVQVRVELAEAGIEVSQLIDLARDVGAALRDPLAEPLTQGGGVPGGAALGQPRLAVSV